MILVKKQVNSYQEGSHLPQAQSKKSTNAPLVKFGSKGKPLNNFSFGSVDNDFSGTEPAACAISAHMEHRQPINEGEEQLTDRSAVCRASNNRARGSRAVPAELTGGFQPSRASEEGQDTENHKTAEGYPGLPGVPANIRPPSPGFRGGGGVRARVGRKAPIFAGDLE